MGGAGKYLYLVPNSMSMALVQSTWYKCNIKAIILNMHLWTQFKCKVSSKSSCDNDDDNDETYKSIVKVVVKDD